MNETSLTKGLNAIDIRVLRAVAQVERILKETDGLAAREVRDRELADIEDVLLWHSLGELAEKKYLNIANEAEARTTKFEGICLTDAGRMALRELKEN